MRGSRLAQQLFCSLAFVGILPAQPTAKVDFGNDVLPILRQNCVGCHGPSQQISGLRLDRKSSVLGRRGVVPGSSENSFLYHRISGTAYGLQMPPTGPLRPEQINVIKTWIDQGADWPDALANEAELPPLNPKAVAMVEALRAGDLPGFMKSVAEDAKLLNARGPEGSTPFMYAVLYARVKTLEQLFKKGADPNKRNDASVTALMWAATDPEKTRLLLDHGADANARSNDMRTPLMIAARRPGNASTVKLLLDHGANPNPNAHPAAESSPLIEAATAADAGSMELVIGRGADVKASAQQALEMAVSLQCSKMRFPSGCQRSRPGGVLPRTAKYRVPRRRQRRRPDARSRRGRKCLRSARTHSADVRGRIGSPCSGRRQTARRARRRHQREESPQAKRRLRTNGARHREAPRRHAGGCMVSQSRREGYGPELASSETTAGEHDPTCDPGKYSNASEGGRQFRS